MCNNGKSCAGAVEDNDHAKRTATRPFGVMTITFIFQSPTEICSGFHLWSNLNCGIQSYYSWLRWETLTPEQRISVSISVSKSADSVYCVLPYWAAWDCRWCWTAGGEIVSCLLLATEGEEVDVQPEALSVVVHFNFEVISPREHMCCTGTFVTRCNKPPWTDEKMCLIPKNLHWYNRVRPRNLVLPHFLTAFV